MAFLDNEGVSFLWQKIKTKFGARVYYGVCSTASDSASKIVSIDDDFSLVEGAMIVVKFTNANSIASPTLNVNGTGAKPIYRYGTTAVSTGTTTTGWIAGSVQLFIYDGTGWVRDYWNNTTYSNASLGSGYATCSTAEATVAKAGTLSSYSLTTGGIVSVKFTNAVPASATLNINSKGAKAIYFRGSAITADVIKAGDIATFVYSSQYHLISIDRWQNDINSFVNTVSSLEQQFADKLNKEDVFELSLTAQFTNIFDTVSMEYGKMLNSDGTVSDTTASLVVTDFIPITAGKTVYMDDFAGYIADGQNTPCVNLYDSSKNFLQHAKFYSIANQTYYFSDLEYNEEGYLTKFKVLRPATTAYMRICTNTITFGENPALAIDEEINYEYAYGGILKHDVKVDYSQIVNSPQKNCWSILPNEHLNIAYSQVNKDGKAVKPINTLEHFVHIAENYGYNALKCDVRPTSDGELVLCHDAGFTFDSNGKITTYNSSNQTIIRNVTASTCLGYSFPTGEHPCLIGDYLDVCRKYGKIAFITIRNEYMDVVIPKLIEELKNHNMTYSTIINCMTYESLVQWRTYDKEVMINYTLAYGVNIDQAAIDKAIGLGYCSINGFGLSSSSTTPTTTCDFEYARENGVRVLQAIAYKEGTVEDCYALGYDGCHIGYAWNPVVSGISEEDVSNMIEDAIGSAIGGAY